MLVAPILSTGASLFLIVRSEAIASSLFDGHEEPASENERAMYRVALSAVAILILSETLPGFLRALGMTIVERYESGQTLGYVDPTTLIHIPYFFAFTFKLLIGLYLLFGAPHIVDWQMCRTRGNSFPYERIQFRISHLLIAMTLVAVILTIMANFLHFRWFAE